MFRSAVLRADPVCVCPYSCDWHLSPTECLTPSHIADHFPMSKRDLITEGLDDNDPERGRGLCKRCHDHYTYHIENR